MAFGRLERNKAPQPMSEINMTPLIDVMLVLLVIFIITAPLLVSSVQLDLPKASGTSAPNAPQFVELSIDPKGQVFVNDRLLDNAELGRVLAQAAQRNADTELRLRADTSVPYGRVAEVMGLAQSAGLSRVGFVADAPTPPAKP